MLSFLMTTLSFTLALSLNVTARRFQLADHNASEMQKLTNLQVFLMRHNQLSGPLIDFAPLTKLRNVWLDTNVGLTGTLESLGKLPQLTFLQASNIPGIIGSMPQSLCGIDCHAQSTNVTCDASLPKGCCLILSCGAASPAPTPPPTSMGECFPQ